MNRWLILGTLLAFIFLTVPISATTLDTFLIMKSKTLANAEQFFVGKSNISCDSIYGSVTDLCTFNSSNLSVTNNYLTNDSYVLKSGDNMTGNLLINQSPNQILLGYESNIGGQTIETIYNDGLSIFSSGFYIIGDGSTSFFSCTASSCTNSFVLEPATSSVQFIGTLYDSSGSGSLGASASPWSSLYLSTSAGKGIGTSANPTTDSNLDLGSTTRRWRTLYLGNTGLISNGTIRPQTTNNIDLGSSTFRFRDLYANRISYFNITNATTTNTSNLEVKNNSQFNGSVNFLNNTLFKLPLNDNYVSTNYSIQENSTSRTCNDTFDSTGCNSTTLNDALLSCNGTQVGSNEHVEEVYINATAIRPNNPINATCQFREKDNSLIPNPTYEYMWYYNGTNWTQLYYNDSCDTGLGNCNETKSRNVSIVFNVNSTEGQHVIRCSIDYNAQSSNYCNSTSTRRDTDDINFTVVNADTGWFNYTITTNSLPLCSNTLRGNLLRQEDDTIGDSLYVCEYNSTDYLWRQI